MQNISSIAQRRNRGPCPLPGFTLRGHEVLQEQGFHVLTRDKGVRPGFTLRGHRVLQDQYSHVLARNGGPRPGFTLRGHRLLQEQGLRGEIEKFADKVLQDYINKEVDYEALTFMESRERKPMIKEGRFK